MFIFVGNVKWLCCRYFVLYTNSFNSHKITYTFHQNKKNEIEIGKKRNKERKTLLSANFFLRNGNLMGLFLTKLFFLIP